MKSAPLAWFGCRNEVVNSMPVRFDRIYVQFGKLKKKLRPWRTVADFGFIEGSPDDPVLLDDFGDAPDDGGLIVGLTVERLKREVKFGIPGSAVAMRNGIVLADDDLVVPGDVIEFVKKRKRRKTAAGQPLPLSETQGVPHTVQSEPQETTVAANYDPAKFVVSRQDLAVHYRGKTCELGNTKMFELLERLKRCPKDYISYDTLKQDVWKDDLVEDKTVQKQVSLLRAALLKDDIGGVIIDGKQKGHYTLRLT